MLMNEMLNAQEQLNLLKLIYDNTWAALNQQAKRQVVKHKSTVSHNVSRPAAAKRKTKHRAQAKPAAVPVPALPKPQIQPAKSAAKPKPFNTPTLTSRMLPTAIRVSDSNSQFSNSTADAKTVGKMGVVSRNTNTL